MFLQISVTVESTITLKTLYFIPLLTSVMGKAEGHGENWHGHVTALTVAPEYRRLGLARQLMEKLEDISEK